ELIAHECAKTAPQLPAEAGSGKEIVEAVCGHNPDRLDPGVVCIPNIRIHVPISVQCVAHGKPHYIALCPCKKSITTGIVVLIVECETGRRETVAHARAAAEGPLGVRTGKRVVENRNLRPATDYHIHPSGNSMSIQHVEQMGREITSN